MEEIYKPTDADKVEIYSREQQEILGDMPRWLIYTGSYIVYGLIALLLIGSTFFKYPDQNAAVHHGSCRHQRDAERLHPCAVR